MTCAKIICSLDQRLTKRRVDEIKLAKSVSEYALTSGAWRTATAHGGEVDAKRFYRRQDIPNAEVAIAVSDPMGLTVVWIGLARADVCTDRTIASVIFSDDPIFDIYDKRVTKLQRLDFAWERLKAEHAYHFSPIEKLASMAI